MKNSGQNLLIRFMAAWMTFSIGVMVHLAWSFQNSLTGDANQLVVLSRRSERIIFTDCMKLLVCQHLTISLTG